uniref:19 kDa protein n=1 Tax=Grapevine virus A TaxID=35288 RepID=Q7T465_9VIRU|nr:19 kDa protein [Grapevine virus A]
MTSQSCTELVEFLSQGGDRCSLDRTSLESLSYTQCLYLLSDLRGLGYHSIDSILHILECSEAERFEIYRIFRRHGIGIGEALQLGVRKSLCYSPRSTAEILDDLLSRISRGGAFLPSDLGAVKGELLVTFQPSRLSVDLYANNKKVCTRTCQGKGDAGYVARRFSGYKGLALRSQGN